MDAAVPTQPVPPLRAATPRRVIFRRESSTDSLVVRTVGGWGSGASAGAAATGAATAAGGGAEATRPAGVSIDSTKIVVRPMAIRRPDRTWVLTSLPLTLVPLPEPRSLTRYRR